jgi:uncharacterized protein YdhG (YjbR/CyaY superfamily)
MITKKSSFASMDDYIATFPEDVQNILKQVRSTIKAAAPKAEETISYEIPTFKLNGKYLTYFAGWKNHISIYPIPAGDTAFRKAVEPYVSGKGTLKFPLDKPIPYKLITQMVKLQIAANLEKTGYRSKGDKK